MKLTRIEPTIQKTAPIQKYGVEKAREVVAFHRTIPEYSPTPLVKLQGLADYLGIQNIYVKDESKRFGLNAFKGLGGSFAIHKIAKKEEDKPVFVTATDGNHGRGVAWAAARLGYEAHVYLPKGSAMERLENIKKLGAYAEITEMCYDDTVRYAAKMAEEHGWILVQDTSWEGYQDIPSYVMQGYTTMGYEIVQQLENICPTHIFLQAGVGSMAGALTAFFADYYKEEKPIIIIVEPDEANCIYLTAQASDGYIHNYNGEMKSMMAGLCCGEPCPIAWDLIKDYADYSISCSDTVSANGMRILGNPFMGDTPIVSGESGAVTTGIAAEIMRKEENAWIRKELQMNSESVVLCISTEGDTDRKNYRDIVWFGNNSDEK